MKRLIFIIVLLLCCNTQLLIAQIKPSFHFTEDDGLAGNTVRDICKDKNGFLLIATNNGLSRYDGEKFQTVNVSGGLPSNDIFAVTVDESNTVYLGCYKGGLAILQNDSVKHILHFSGKLANTFRKLFYSDYYQKVFVGTDDGIFILQDTLLIPIDYGKDTKVKSQILSISGKGDKIFFTVLKGESEGLYQMFYNKDHPEKSYAKRILIKGKFSTMMMGDTLYSGYYNQINKYGIHNLQKIIPPSIVDSTFFIWSMTPYKNNKYWIGGLGEGRFFSDILLFDSKRNTKQSLLIKQNNQTVFSIYNDTTSNITWFGRENGLTAFYESSFEYTDCPDNGNIIDIGFAGDSLMVLTENNVFYLKGNKLIPVLTKNQVKSRIILEWRKYAGRYGDKFTKSLDKSMSCEFATFNQDGSKLYISTAKGQISVPDLKTYLPFDIGAFMIINKSAYANFRYYPLRYYPFAFESINYATPRTTKDELSYVFEMVENQGLIYMASSVHGMYAVKNNKYFYIDDSNSKIDNTLTDIDIDSNGNIWCCSSNAKLFEIGFSDSLYVKLALDLSKCGLVGNTCKWIKFNRDHLYIGTNKGLNVISIKNLNTEQPHIEHFYNNFNGYDYISAGSPITDTNGNLYLHSLHQLIKINPSIHQNSIVRLNIYNASINGNKTAISKLSDKKLPYSYQQISFRFNAIKYPLSRNLEYRYSINNQKYISDNYVALQSLRSGKYTIVLEAYDKENMHRYSESLSFTIKTPFWRTGWFIILTSIFLMLIVFVLMRLRIKWLKAQHEKHTQLVTLNSELRLRSLQLQMNPHFLFNALQSIQGFILNSSVEDGLVYIGNLGSVIRSNLENASEEYIHLSTEIEFLKKYVEIEKIRFKDKLNVEFTNNVTDSNIMLPPMLIQPIIENAIKHGIRSTDKVGLIKVDFAQTTEQLIISVEDNGAGREFTMKQARKDHNGKGMGIITQRLNLLNTKNNNCLNQIEIIDLYSGDKASGTMVIIRLMIKHTL